MSTIFYQGDQGLGQGIQGAGNILGQALQQVGQRRGAQKQQQNLSQILQNTEIDENLIRTLASQPGGPEFLNSIGPLIAPILKQQAKFKEEEKYLRQNFPESFGDQQKPPVSPIDEIKSNQRNGTEAVSYTHLTLPTTPYV